MNAHDYDLIAEWSNQLDNIDGYSAFNDLLKQHEDWRDSTCINLLGAEGPMSAKARGLLSSSLASRTAAGHIGLQQRFFAGTEYIDHIEALCHALCMKLFACHYAEHRVLGGTQANQIVYSALLHPNDTIISVSPIHGGDSSTHNESILSSMNIHILDMPFTESLQIDFTALESLMCGNTIKLLSLGFSVSLYHQDFERLAKLCKKYHIYLHADCAHELGLIAGNVYPNPLKLGADIMTGSTGKTLSGPQGGLILWQDRALSEKICQKTFPFHVGAYQNNRILALTMTLLEFEQFGEAYMQQVCANAQSLAAFLSEQGLAVINRQGLYTQTHQVIFSTEQTARTAMRDLESYHLITSMAQIPGLPEQGIRLGVVECTRLGMHEYEMNEIGTFITDSYFKRKSIKNIKQQVKNFKENFDTYYYCHEFQLQ